MTLFERLFHLAEQLRGTPQILELISAGLDEASANWKPAPDRFSVLEVVRHLRHTEADFIERVELIKKGADLPRYDPQAFMKDPRYASDSLPKALTAFRSDRAYSISILQFVPIESFTTKSRHEVLGDVSITELMNEWAFHDLGHIRQIAELVRSRLYYPEMGPYRDMYQIAP